ncbi:MAG TPA: inositol monophosphatase, partial [Candidatus Marinimicrobia bacterium]|nr:inositol monophosphatase [Candidatus Neomarinimicrobiota bacterium]
YNQDLYVEHKGRVDLVTEADKASEDWLKRVIFSRFSHHTILAEESSYTGDSSDFLWIIDPLDGTTNYAHSFPMFCISIALQYQNETRLAVIFDPLRNEIFSAILGNGAYLNDKKIHVSKTDKLLESLLGTGFPYIPNTAFHRNFALFHKIYPQTQGIRRGGSAALDLAYTACGRFDGFWEFDLKPWDCAAGMLLIEEAGGLCTQSNGDPASAFIPDICASNGLIHAALLENFR